MNFPLIEKVIKSNNDACLPLIYQNPVLDRKVATALSKSFVKIMKVTGRNSNINSNLRLSVLENIRKLCRLESENHLRIDENVTELLTEVYHKNIEEAANRDLDITDRLLDEYLLKRLKCMEMDSSLKSLVNPEVIQALNNLDENGLHLSQHKMCIHWDVQNQKCLNVLKDMWNNSNIKCTTFPEVSLDIISVKMKSEIEVILLETCYNILNTEDFNIDAIFASDSSTNNPIFQLVKNCAVSPECFQIYFSILNHLFVTKNFNVHIEKFILASFNQIKLFSPSVSISILYPNHLHNIVLLLDIDINELSDPTRDSYIKIVTFHLKSLNKESESDLILLLSHFPDWFDIYFEQ